MKVNNLHSGRHPSAYAFIGEVAASSTHEINNELAVINEQSRLTAELLALGRMGQEVDPAELEHLLNRVIARVERADRIVQRVNTFAHSLERDDNTCDLAECLELMNAMFGRKAGLKGVSLEAGLPEKTLVGLGTLACEQLLWRALAVCLEAAQADSVLKVFLEPGGGEAQVVIDGVFEKPFDLTFFHVWEPFGVTVKTSEQSFILGLPGAVS